MFVLMLVRRAPDHRRGGCPYLPYPIGRGGPPAAMVITAVALVSGGMVVGQQLLLGAVAAAVTFAVGRLIGDSAD